MDANLKLRFVLILIFGVGYKQVSFSNTNEQFLANAENSSKSSWLHNAHEQFDKGRFRQCITILESSLSRESDYGELHFHALLLRATAHQHLGFFQAAFDDLKSAYKIAENLDLAKHVTALIQLSDLHLSVGRIAEALSLGQRAVKEARDLNTNSILAVALNNWGNILLVNQHYRAQRLDGDTPLPLNAEDLVLTKRGVKVRPYAEQKLIRIDSQPPASTLSAIDIASVYDDSANLARQSNNLTLAIRSTINKAKVALIVKDLDQVYRALQVSKTMVKELPRNFEKGFLELSLGVLALHAELASSIHQRLSFKHFAWNTFYSAVQIGKNIDNAFLQSTANGYLGKLYGHDNRLNEAIQLTRTAIFFAQQESKPELLYRWQWQLARLLNRSGEQQKAIQQYRKTIQILEKVRNVLTVGYRDVPDIFKEHIKPVYYELAELYLKQAQHASEKPANEKLLRQARDTIETMKTAELEDYFQDECIVAYLSTATSFDKHTEGTAVIYPMFLKDRVALLVTLPDGIHQFSSPIPVDSWSELLHNYRWDLQDGSSTAYMEKSQRLYGWLIRPIRRYLEDSQIKTLIIVPDGALTLIPFSTLHDGQQFLTENYAVVTTPGLQLVDSKAMDRSNVSSLIVGLSESVQDYPALPSVAEEVRLIAEMLDGKTLPNYHFTVKRITDELKERGYGLLHIATHGEFNPDPEKTFILTYDQKLTLSQLEQLIKYTQFYEDPLELLTLSACQTAVGDERAALGLAGAAVKSGARSVIASLWHVDDEATMQLITEFYHQYFLNSDLTKAEALQNAQKKLMAMEQFKHPSKWAPFLIIGNWL